MDTVADLERTSQERELTKAVATRRILASCEDIRCSETSLGLSCGGFLEYSVFPPFLTRGKRFFDAISTKGSIAVFAFLPTHYFGYKNFLSLLHGNSTPSPNLDFIWIDIAWKMGGVLPLHVLSLFLLWVRIHLGCDHRR